MLVSGTSALVFQDKDLEFFIDQRFRAAPCLSTEFLKAGSAITCVFVRFTATHAKSYPIQNANELRGSAKS